MKLFRDYSFKWWQVSLFKLYIISIGLLAGAYFSEIVMQYKNVLFGIFILLMIYFLRVVFTRKILLDVPLVKQPLGSIECSIASLKMVLEYYGDNTPYTDLVKSLSEWINEEERHIQGVAIYLVKRGYDVKFSHYDLLDEETENLTEKDSGVLEGKLKTVPDEKGNKFRRKKISLDLEYIKAGGKYSTKLPDLSLIENALSEKTPVIVVVNLRIFLLDPTRTNNHSVVIIGEEDDYYIVNDPGHAKEGQYKVSKMRLLMAWYRCGAYALVIKNA